MSCAVRIVVAQEDLATCVTLLEQAFFTDLDHGFFAADESTPEARNIGTNPRTSISIEQQVFTSTRNYFALRGAW